ncbi:hypothetical protein [Bdellovibrio sp. HCB337]|uniref:hypothetical protein n=1 Tax=Bdellovibrio sp. HCB337 TaxID=3394358 RepID=UPI0039A67E1C
MNCIRAFRLNSFAHYFFSVIVAILFVYTSPAQAEPLTREKCETMPDSEKNDKIRRECAKYTSADSDCEDAKREARDALKELNKSVGSSGMSMSRVQKCFEMGAEDEYSNDPDLLMAFSEALGVPQNQFSSSTCPKYSGQGFMDRKDKYDKDLETINDEIKSTKEDIADTARTFTKDIKEVQEDIADAQKELKEKQREIGKEQSERLKEKMETAAKIAADIRAQENAKFSNRQKIANIIVKKNSSLIQMNFDSVKYACLVDARKFAKDYQESTSGGSPGSVINRANRKKKAVQNKYDTCMAQINEQRNAVVMQADQEIESTQKAIEDAQSQIDNLAQQLSSLEAIENQTKNDEAKAVNEETQALSEKITRATTDMRSIQKEAEEKDAALKEKLNKLQRRSTEVSNSLSRLGTPPEDETSDVKMSQLTSAYDDYQAAVSMIPALKSDGSVCDYKDPLTSKGSSGGSPSSIRSNNKGSNGSGSTKAKQ